jgi:short-subunit dehydrogenase
MSYPEAKLAGSGSEVVAITGASAGLGRAIAQEFARHGARIGLIARGRERLDQAVLEMCDLGGKAIAVCADVADAAQVEAAAQEIESALGPIDIWVNNAMTTIFAEFTEISADEYRRATEVTYLGAVWGTMAALKRMLLRDRGAIVQVGSALAYRSIPLQAPYCGAKHAIAGFTDSLRTELIHRKSQIGLSMVHMPALNTPQFDWCRTRMRGKPQPVPPVYNPEVPARAVYWAAHHRQREIYVGLSTRAAIFGNQVAPGFLDYYLGRTGYGSQQSDEPTGSDRPDNLFESVPGDFAAHGRFDRKAVNRGFSPLARRAALWGAVAAVLIASSRLASSRLRYRS